MAIMAALAIAQGVAGFMDANNKAKAQEAYYQQNRINAAVARDLKIQGLQKQAIQSNEQIAQQKLDLEIAALKRAGTMEVAAGEAGVTGQTEALKFTQAEAEKLRGLDVYNAQVNAIFDQIEMEKLGLNSEMINRIQNVQRGQKPSLGMALLSTASSAIAGEAEFGQQADKWVGDFFGSNSTALPATQ